MSRRREPGAAATADVAVATGAAVEEVFRRAEECVTEIRERMLFRDADDLGARAVIVVVVVLVVVVDG